MSVAIWVGFLALFGIATDNGVVTATYLEQTLSRAKADNTEAIRELVVKGATRRIRPALMTTATTLIALIPILTSDGRGSDIMVPMAIPSFGGMLVAIITTLMVPVLYCAVQELRQKQTPSGQT
jgi:Cu(I)/Ag(I) efflux system membrane protein CusA/SilA